MSGASAVTGTGTPVQETKAYKAVVAVAGAAVLAVAAVISDGITRAEGAQIAVAVLGSLSIWLAANLPTFRYTKGIIAVLGGLTTVVVSYLTGGQITAAEWWNLLIVGLTAVGVIVIPNPAAPVSLGARLGAGSDRGAIGNYSVLAILGVILLVVGIGALVLTLLGVAHVSYLAAIIIAAIGLVLVLLSNRGPGVL